MSGNSWANMGQECIKCHINVYPHKQVRMYTTDYKSLNTYLNTLVINYSIEDRIAAILWYDSKKHTKKLIKIFLKNAVGDFF